MLMFVAWVEVLKTNERTIDISLREPVAVRLDAICQQQASRLHASNPIACNKIVLDRGPMNAQQRRFQKASKGRSSHHCRH